MRKLTFKQEAFVREYIGNDGNATQAAIDAGYSAKSAESIGEENLRKPVIQSAIEKYRKKLAEKWEIQRNDVLKSLISALFFDPADLFDDNGNIRKICDLPKMARLAIEGITIEEKGKRVKTRVTKIKTSSKAQARDQALKVLGLYRQGEVDAEAMIGKIRTLFEEWAALKAGKAAPIPLGEYNGEKGRNLQIPEACESNNADTPQ